MSHRSSRSRPHSGHSSERRLMNEKDEYYRDKKRYDDGYSRRRRRSRSYSYERHKRDDKHDKHERNGSRTRSRSRSRSRSRTRSQRRSERRSRRRSVSQERDRKRHRGSNKSSNKSSHKSSRSPSYDSSDLSSNSSVSWSNSSVSDNSDDSDTSTVKSSKHEKKSKKEKKKKKKKDKKDKTEEEASHRTNIKQSELTKIGVLGKGSFGMVELVKHGKSKRTFALKSVAKAEIVKTGQQEHIISEKNVMIMLDSRFIVKLYQTFNTTKYLFFLLEVVLGGELFTVLRQRTVFDESTARFYAASVVCAFGYMHDKNVIYRDLKPENLLLDNNGYLKITDFGFAKIVKDRTYTLCGTPDYLAPEVISGAGHGKGVDWWTLGILLFEMLASYPPFYDEDPMRTYAKIMYGKVKYPKHFSHDAVEIIKGFLTAKATKRLGIIKGGVQKIEDYKWFYGFDWNSLKNGTMKAPIIPTVSGIEDRSNFDVYEDDEQIDDTYKDDGSGWDKDF